MLPGWEYELLHMAQKGQSPHVLSNHRGTGFSPETYKHAYVHCSEITRAHSKTFYLASSLMGAPKRNSVRALYAFCRMCDDTVDKPSESDPQKSLETWREKSLSAGSQEDELVAIAWNDTRLRHGIPAIYVEQLIDGVAQDLKTVRYQDFPSLASYCYGVASTVGLMAMHIIGFKDQDAIPYAVRLGIALQLTNILRDVGEDWRMGRMYLPLDELHGHGLREDDIALGIVTPRWRKFMKFQIARVRDLYRTSLPGVKLLDKSGRFATYAAGILYERILDEIEKNDYDVFTRRAHTSKLTKLKLLPGIWWKSMTE